MGLVLRCHCRGRWPQVTATRRFASPNFFLICKMLVMPVGPL